jgi:hypothetical protein
VSEMVERVARALFAQEWAGTDGPSFKDDGHHEYWMRAARAAAAEIVKVAREKNMDAYELLGALASAAGESR